MDKNTEAHTIESVALDTKLDQIRRMRRNIMTHPSNVILDALDDYICPSGKILGNHR